MPWWLAVVIVSVVGWVSANGAVHFYLDHHKDLLALRPNDAALTDELAKGAAKRDSALLLGWLYALVYALPWLAVYALVNMIREQMCKIKCLPRS